MVSLVHCQKCNRIWGEEELRAYSRESEGRVEIRCVGCGALHEAGARPGEDLSRLAFRLKE